MSVKIIPSSCENIGIDMCSNRKPSDLDYVDNVVLLSEESSKVQVFLDRLNDSVGMFWGAVCTSIV